MSLTKLNHKVTKLSITLFFNFNEFLKFKWSVHHCKTKFLYLNFSQKPPLSLRSFTAWCCLCARHCCKINCKIWTDGNCLVSILYGDMDMQAVDIHNKICRIFLLPCPYKATVLCFSNFLLFQQLQHVSVLYELRQWFGALACWLAQ